MIVREPENGGVRAWILLRVKEPEAVAVAGGLYGALGYPPQRQEYPWIKRNFEETVLAEESRAKRLFELSDHNLVDGEFLRPRGDQAEVMTVRPAREGCVL